jgi:glycosyltransferase involved in cell wall biosynthesis
MSAGLPILSSLTGELDALIRAERIGLQYEAGNAHSLVQGIRQYLTEAEARKKMGMRARKLFEERFSAKAIYPKLIAHLRKIASK